MLTGELTKKELYRECAVFKENAKEYVPDKDAVTRIKRIKDPISVIMFLGTWCSNSQRESPMLLKILDTAKDSKISFTMYGVDTKKDEGGVLAKWRPESENMPTKATHSNGSLEEASDKTRGLPGPHEQPPRDTQ